MAEQQKTIKPEAKAKKNLRYQRDRDREKVKGIFRFHEMQGGELRFCFRAHKGDPIEKYELEDGKIYELPLGVAKHLNKNGWYPVHENRINENGTNSVHIGKKIKRFEFNSLEFTDVDDFDATGEIEIIKDISLVY